MKTVRKSRTKKKFEPFYSDILTIAKEKHFSIRSTKRIDQKDHETTIISQKLLTNFSLWKVVL